MKIVMFASYKGGVGRTLTLANVAVNLTRIHGLRIGMIDLDFEAAGLHQVFELDVSENDSLIDAIIDDNPTKAGVVSMDLTDDGYFKPNLRKSDRCFCLLPGHNDDPSIFDQIKWNAQQTKTLKTAIDMWGQVKGLDLIFIDTRAGISGAYASTMSLCDGAFLVFRLNRQNHFGVQWMLKHLREREIPAALVACQVPDDPKLEGKIKSRIDLLRFEWQVKDMIDQIHQIRERDNISMDTPEFEQLVKDKIDQICHDWVKEDAPIDALEFDRQIRITIDQLRKAWENNGISMDSPATEPMVDTITKDLRKYLNINEIPIYEIPYVPEMALEECILTDQEGPTSKVAKAYNSLAERIKDQFL